MASEPSRSTADVELGHHVQRTILLQLRQIGQATYAQLKPAGMEGNAFNYHLRLLRRSGLVERDGTTYKLTPTGHLVSDAYSQQTQRLMLRPHGYTVLLVTTPDRTVLVYEINKALLKDRLSLPAGKVHFGDSFLQSIAKEMAKRGLTNKYTATMLCPINVRYRYEQQVVLQRPGIVWHIDYYGPCNDSQTVNGRAFWMSYRDVSDSLQALPELVFALQHLQNKSHDPIDLDTVL